MDSDFKPTNENIMTGKECAKILKVCSAVTDSKLSSSEDYLSFQPDMGDSYMQPNHAVKEQQQYFTFEVSILESLQNRAVFFKNEMDMFFT